MRFIRSIPVILVAAGLSGCGSSVRTSGVPVGTARPVLVTAASEEGPAASGDWFAWMQSAETNPSPPRSRTSVFVKRNGKTIRVNPRGTYAQTGGIDGNQLVIQITAGGRSRLAVYDLATHKLRYLPAYINDGAWLWRPDIDGHRILYGAIVPGRSAVLRYEIRIADLDRHTVRTLARLDGHAEYAAPGQLQGNWATWVSCPESTCNVRRENLATGITDSPPDPSHLVYTQLGPAVNGRGVVYYERTLGQCGQTEIRRWNGQTDSLVTRLPPDSAYQYAYLAKHTIPSLYFDRVGCSRKARSDLYEIPVPAGRR